MTTALTAPELPDDEPEESGLVSSRHNINYNTAPDVFEVTISKLTDLQQETLRFWYFLGKERQWSLPELGRRCGVSSTTLSRVFRGTYGAGLDKVCETLAKARASFTESVGNPDFIMTSLAAQMFENFDATRDLAVVSIMWGPKGIGKTTVAENYKIKNNHGRTIYVRCLTAMTFAQFVHHVGQCMGIHAKGQNQFRLRNKIVGVMSAGNRLLIVDELHLLFETMDHRVAVKCCEFLREVYDRSGCGMSLIGTDVMRKEFFEGASKKVLEQLVDRGPIQVPLPTQHTKADVTACLKHYGLKVPGADEPDAAQALKDMVEAHGLRKLTLHLRMGARMAIKAGEVFGWPHFVASIGYLASLAKSKK